MRAGALLPLLLVACVDLKRAPEPTAPNEEAPTTTVEPTHPNETTHDESPPLKQSPVSSRPEAGPDASVDAPAVVAENAKRICASYCDAGARCDDRASGSAEWLADCQASCQKMWVGRAPHLREEFVAYAEQCYETLYCNQSRDTCLHPWSELDPSTTDTPVVSACLSRKATCGLLEATDCNDGLAYDEPTRGILTRCFARSCLEIDECLKSARGD